MPDEQRPPIILEHDEGEIVAEQLTPTAEGNVVEQLRRVEHGDFRYTLHDRDTQEVGEHKSDVRLFAGDLITREGRRFCVVDHVPPAHRFTDPDYDGYALLKNRGRVTS